MQIPRVAKAISLSFSLFLLLALNAAPGLAETAALPAPKGDVESVLTQKKIVIGSNKKETVSDVKDVKPGELIEYRAAYTNKGKAAVTNFSATLPIPEATEYQRGTATPAMGVKATVGDGKFLPIPLKRKVKLPDGKEVEQDVPLAQYKALQWSFGELGAGKTVVISARVRVSDTPAAPAGAPPTTTGGPK